MACPFYRREFATATGVTRHVESGSCPKASNINRDQLYKFIRTKDPEGRISKKLIGWTGQECNAGSFFCIQRSYQVQATSSCSSLRRP